LSNYLIHHVIPIVLKLKYIIIFITCGRKKQVKENFVSFVSFAIPMSMPNNIPIFPIIENNHSIIKDLPILENISIIEKYR